tara:strand:+ start:214 stop:708 length:495 start_codon:yes stop_codon:yes gene_type:complete
MAASTIPKVRRDGSITFEDSGAGNSLTVTYEDGNFAFDGSGKADRIVIRDRGTIVGVRKGDDPVITGSFSVHFREFTNGSAAILADVIDGVGGASSWTSTGGGAFEQHMLTLKFICEATDHGESADAVAAFSKVVSTWAFSESDPDTLTVSFECFGGVAFVGQA